MAKFDFLCVDLCAAWYRSEKKAWPFHSCLAVEMRMDRVKGDTRRRCELACERGKCANISVRSLRLVVLSIMYAREVLFYLLQ